MPIRRFWPSIRYSITRPSEIRAREVAREVVRTVGVRFGCRCQRAQQRDLTPLFPVGEVVAERFAREAPALRPLPATRYDTSYWELRQVGWDAYIDVRGNRYSVPAALAGQRVTVRIGLDGQLAVYADEALVARHALQPAGAGWVTVPAHHAPLWRGLEVERRPLAVYEEVARWS